MKESLSENNGLAALSGGDSNIYSVGISTGGVAEMRMAEGHPARKIIATTIDQDGATFASHIVNQSPYSSQITVKIEDVSAPLPYRDEHFDFVYARLVLHYLPKDTLQKTLKELYRVLKVGGKLFVVVRSVDCFEAQHNSPTVDSETGFTAYISEDGSSWQRYFHTKESIGQSISSTGFQIEYTKNYQEHLCVDFERKIPSQHIDSLIEVLSVKPVHTP